MGSRWADGHPCNAEERKSRKESSQTARVESKEREDGGLEHPGDGNV